jgi:hypothetical protein
MTTFSRAGLRALMRDHGDWTYAQYAEALGATEEAVTKCVQRWRDDGEGLPDFRRLRHAWILHKSMGAQQLARQARWLAGLLMGDRPGGKTAARDERQAWELLERCKSAGQVVDAKDGVPFLRDATTYELCWLDSRNMFFASPEGGWSEYWHGLPPGVRRPTTTYLP